MIKYLSIVFFLAISTITTQAQGLYSQENLEKVSTKDLSLYLNKAQKVKKAGGVLLIAAPVSATLGILLWTNAWRGGSENEFYLGTGLIITSLVSTVTGIPVRITGASRVKKLSMVLNTRQGATIMNINPCSIYNSQTRNIQPGIKLRIIF
jgi:hypothetical protein